MKILVFFIMFLLTSFFNGINATNTESRIGSGVFSLGLSKYKHRSQIKTENKSFSSTNLEIMKKVKLLPGTIYFQGWIRFFKYTGENLLRPSHFFTNPQYSLQRVTKRDMRRKDPNGYLNINDKFAFYAKLTMDKLSILGTRVPLPNGDVSQIVDNLQIKYIKPIDKKNRNRSSVNDIGNFKEGKCLQVYTRVPVDTNLEYDIKTSNGKNENWIICFDNMKNKTKFISLLILLKENQQVEEKKHVQSKKPLLKQLLNGGTNLEKRSDSTPKDGYWILLQDWTSCSLKCGGGKSFQQWMCFPPKKGGRKCSGKPVRIRACNTQPCPGTKTHLNGSVVKTSPLDSVNPSIIVSSPFSNRPQNYMKCEIKENDVFYIDIKNDKITKRPSRIILNKRTISLYTDVHFKDNVFSFDLKETNFTPYKEDKCCFNLESGSDIYTICGGFGQRCGGDRENYSFFQDWRDAFNLFKTGCYQKLKKEDFLLNKANKKQKELLEAAGIANLEDRANVIKKNIKKKEIDVMAGKITSTQALAFKAIRREFDIEKMLTSEIQLKSQLEAKELMERMRREQKKRECLDKAFNASKIEHERLRETQSSLQRIKSIQSEARNLILKKRAQMRNKIKELLGKSKRRKRQMETEIIKIRGTIAKKLVEADHKGSHEPCVKGIDNKELRTDYCKHFIVDNFVLYNECLNEGTYGNICCETEFGNMHMDLRDNCFSLCDKRLGELLNSGEFV